MIWWCVTHKSAALVGGRSYCTMAHYQPKYYPFGDCSMVEALLIVKDSPQIEIEVQSVHPMSIECYDLPLWQSIMSDWRYLLVSLGPVQPEEET